MKHKKYILPIAGLILPVIPYLIYNIYLTKTHSAVLEIDLDAVSKYSSVNKTAYSIFLIFLASIIIIISLLKEKSILQKLKAAAAIMLVVLFICWLLDIIMDNFYYDALGSLEEKLILLLGNLILFFIVQLFVHLRRKERGRL